MTNPANTIARANLTVPLMLLFIGSGCATLIYEVVWFHMLRIAIGATAVSVTILLSCYMGGMSLGSLLFYKLVDDKKHPLRVYACLEIGIGISALLIYWLLPQVTALYASSIGLNSFDLPARALTCIVLLVPPTVLMGATLPAVSRWIEVTRTGISRMSLFYGANITGAVLGTLLTGFFLLRIYDVGVATAFAVFINFSIAFISLLIARRRPYSRWDLDNKPARISGYNYCPAYIAIALSGMAALGAQIVWMRLLALLFGATVYTFSVTLAVFLTGLGVGSAIGSALVRKIKSPHVALAFCQLFLVVLIPYAGFAINELIPKLHFVAEYQGWILKSIDDLLRCSLVILPATMAWGASFPLALAVVGKPGVDPGYFVGRIYAANTAGSIVGAILFGLVIIPAVGTLGAQQLLTIIGMLATLVIAIPYFLNKTTHYREHMEELTWQKSLLAAIGIVGVGVTANYFLPETHPGMISYGRDLVFWNRPADYLFTHEGRIASIAVSQEKGAGYRNLHINGKVVASNWPADMRLQRMLGHLPALLHHEPKSILVIGFGAGVTAGSFTLHPSVERIVIVEIEAEVPLAATKYFNHENYNILNDPRAELIINDGRHYIANTTEKFDIIATDPIHPWSKGAAALYTSEFFELVSKRLNPGGFVAQWVPLYETDEPAVKSQMATFLDAFTNVSIWNSSDSPINSGYDIVMIAHPDPFEIDARDMQRRLNTNLPLQRSLTDVKFTSVVSLLKSYSGQGTDVTSWLADAALNTDHNLRLEYLAGQSLDVIKKDAIHFAMTRKLEYPEKLFLVDKADKQVLRKWFAAYHWRNTIYRRN